MALVELGRYFNSFEAGVVRSRLADDRIEAFIFDLNMSWDGMGIMIPIRVMVDEDDLEDAQAIIRAGEAAP
jgi:hypothetical protein